VTKSTSCFLRTTGVPEIQDLQCFGNRRKSNRGG
jgi:hypothetical protein